MKKKIEFANLTSSLASWLLEKLKAAPLDVGNIDEFKEGIEGLLDGSNNSLMLEIDDDIRLALNNEKITKEELRKLVYTSNVITLLQDGLNKVLEGITSFEEIYRIIEIDSDDNDDYTTELAEVEEEENQKEQTKQLTTTTNSNVSNNTTSLIEKASQGNSTLPNPNQQQISNVQTTPQIVSSQIQTGAATISNQTSSVLNQQQTPQSEPTLIELPKIEVNIEKPQENRNQNENSSSNQNQTNNNIIQNPNLKISNPTIISETSI